MGLSNFPENWEKDVKTIVITEEDKIVKQHVIGRKYHCSWASSNKMVWTLIDITNNIATLKTKFGKEIKTNVNNLREINKFALVNTYKRLTKQNKL